MPLRAVVRGEGTCQKHKATNIYHLTREPCRYLVIGAICAILNNLILIGGDALGLHYLISVFLTFLLILPLSYFAHASWTFDAHLHWKGFGRFMAGSLVSLAVATFCVGIFYRILQMPMIVAAPLSTVTMTLYNFVMTRWAVGRRRAA